MTTEIIVTITMDPYDRCVVDTSMHCPKLNVVCAAQKNITTYRYQLAGNGDIILQDGSKVNRVVVMGYIDACGHFHEAQPPTYQIVYPETNIPDQAELRGTGLKH